MRHDSTHIDAYRKKIYVYLQSVPGAQMFESEFGPESSHSPSPITPTNASQESSHNSTTSYPPPEGSGSLYAKMPWCWAAQVAVKLTRTRMATMENDDDAIIPNNLQSSTRRGRTETGRRFRFIFPSAESEKTTENPKKNLSSPRIRFRHDSRLETLERSSVHRRR